MKLNALLKFLTEVSLDPAGDTGRAFMAKKRLEKTARPEAPKDAPLGQYLFAPIRDDVPNEPNTNLENQIQNDLTRHYAGTGNPGNIEKSLVQLFDFEKKGMYKKLLEPPAGLVYRYISNIKPEVASALFLNDLPVEQITEEPNKAFYVSPIGIVEQPSAASSVKRGKTNLSSWTTSPRNSAFSNFTETSSGRVAVLMVADVKSNNFVLNPENMSQFAKSLSMYTIEDEQEVIAYGPVNVVEASAIYIKESTGLPKKQISSA